MSKDSNQTGLRIAEEASLKTLPGSPIWEAMEPNDYDDFGAEVITIARNPINPSRQNQKGTVTDLNANGGFGADLIFGQLTRQLQGFFFADVRQKPSTAPVNGTQVTITGVTTLNGYEAASGLGIFAPQDLIFASGFGQAANNGLKQVTAASATAVNAAGLVAEAAPPAGAKFAQVGIQFASADAAISLTGSLPRLTSAAVNLTTLDLIPGEWVFIGGDATGERFANDANNGFARIKSIAAGYIEFDKTSATMVADTGTGKTIRLFFGHVLRNEKDPTLIKRRSWQLERYLGKDDAANDMAEYLVGAVANELTVSVPSTDKVTLGLGFVGLDVEQRDSTNGGLKAGSRPNAKTGDAVNTSSDFSRIKLASVVAGNPNPTPLVGFMTEMELQLSNGVTPKKAIGTLGAFNTGAGNFNVSGSITAYFSDLAACRAVRNNASVTLDVAMVKNNTGQVWDIPLLTLGDGRLAVEQDESIMLPLEQLAAESEFGHTLLMVEFTYLPTLADL